MNTIDQDALEREYRELVFVDVYWTDFSREGVKTLTALHERMKELRKLIDDPVQETVDVEYEAVKANKP